MSFQLPHGGVHKWRVYVDVVRKCKTPERNAYRATQKAAVLFQVSPSRIRVELVEETST